MKKIAKQTVLWLVCLIMLFCSLPLTIYADYLSEPTGEFVEEITYEVLTDDELNEFSSYIDIEKAKELGHVMRLEEEEELNNLVFLNMDGSKSRYYFNFNIKHVDETGKIVLNSSMDLASISNTRASISNNDIEKTIIYTKYHFPKYADSNYLIGSIDNIYGTGFMLVRLNSFCDNGTYANLEPEQIIDVTYNCFGNSNSKYALAAYPYMGNNWQAESAHGGNTSPSFSPHYSANASYTPYSLMWSFNITEMAKAWLSNKIDANKGIYISTYLANAGASAANNYITVNCSGAFSYVVTYSQYTDEIYEDQMQTQLAYGEAENNDSKANANIAVTKDRTTREANSVIKGVIENKSTDDIDWYAIYLKKNEIVDIKLYNINFASDIDMTIYKIGGGTISCNNNVVGMAEYATYQAASEGWCYLKIYGNVAHDSSYSLYIKRNIIVQGKGTFTSSQSLYVVDPDATKEVNQQDISYMYRLGRDVADSSSKLTFLLFNRPAVQINGTQTVYGIDSYEHGFSFYSLSDIENYIELFIDGFNDNPQHNQIEQLAIMVTSNCISYGNHYNTQGVYDGLLTKDDLYFYSDFGEKFAQMIESINNKLSNTDKVKKVVGGFDFETGYEMNYSQCKALEDAFISNSDELLYVMADVNFLWPNSSLMCNDYNFGGGWYASMIYDLCINDNQLRCIPQISVENRINGWITFCYWSAQQNWGNSINNLQISTVIMNPIKLSGLDCCNRFNDGNGGDYYSIEEAVKAFITAYYQYSSDLNEFQYITWMSMYRQAQLNE